jgi:gas vesicle protein
MEKREGSRLIAVSTREMRELARAGYQAGLNQQILPAQFKLLDPKGTHVLSPLFMHNEADGKVVPMHLRVTAHLKLIGKQKAVEKLIDIPLDLIRDYVDIEDEIKRGIGMRAIKLEGDEIMEAIADFKSDVDDILEQNENVKKEVERIRREGEAKREIFEMGDAILENEITKRAEGKS